MEDGLRDGQNKRLWQKLMSLNPCFNGRWSASTTINGTTKASPLGLNPCFNGRWSARLYSFQYSVQMTFVLILVLMEDGLRDGFVHS